MNEIGWKIDLVFDCLRYKWQSSFPGLILGSFMYYVPMICKIKHLFYYNQLQMLFILNSMREKLVIAE